MELRRAINSYLVTLSEAFIAPGDETPPLPDFKTLQAKGIPLIQDDGWNWDDPEVGSYNHEINRM